MVAQVSTPSSASAGSLSQLLSSIGALSSQLQTIVSRRFLGLAWQLVEIRCTMDGEGTAVSYGPITQPHKQRYKIRLHPQPRWLQQTPHGMASSSAAKQWLWLEQTKH